MLAAVAGAAAPLGENLAPLQPGLDYHSFANIEQFRVTHLDLDLRVESSVQELGGVVGLQIKRLDPGATELILDTRDINVVEVTQKAQDVLGATSKSDSTWIGRPFHFERKDPILGAALVIELPPSKRPTEYIRIEYQASPTASRAAMADAQADQAQGLSVHRFRTHRRPELDSAAGHAPGARHLQGHHSHLARRGRGDGCEERS